MALLLLPVAFGFLIYVYLRHGRGERRVVSSVLIMKKLRRQSVSRKKFFPPPRFFIELIILSLITLALSGLYLQKNSRHIAVLIDNSFSMQSKVTANKTLLDRAIEQARAMIDNSPGSNHYMLYVTSPKLMALTKEFLSGRATKSLLGNIRSEAAEDRIGSAIKKISQTGKYEKIIVFSDKKIEALSPDGKLPANTVFPRLVRSNKHLENLAISSLSFGRDIRSEHSLKIKAVGYTSREIVAQILLERADFTTSGPAFSEMLSKTIRLNPGQPQEVRIENFKATADAYRVKLAPHSINSQYTYDAIDSDSYFWFVPDQAQTTIGLISPYTINELGLNRINTLKFKKLNSTQLKTDQLTTGAFRAIIYHRTIPPVLPRYNSLIVLPPVDSPFAAGDPTDETTLSHWDSSHALLSYLNPPALKISSLIPLRVPIWGNEIINSVSGPALIAGVSRDARVVISGFEIFPFQGRKNPALSILTLNILKWLTESSLTGIYRTVPYTISEDQLSSADLLDSIAAAGTRVAAESNSTVTLNRPGLWKLNLANNDYKLVALNYFNSAESDNRNIQKVSVTLPAVRELSGNDKTELNTFMIALAAALLFIYAVYQLMVWTRTLPGRLL
ncbi:MAG: hypothetical protein D6719_06290 [Candidatus Dadabacteria bacterium]|nr:MAG: hypothetical protein D6719_06290 [Candidatus Dadabacteria bacterium]